MNRNILIGIVIVASVALGFFFFRGEEKLPPPKNTTLVAFGDSLVAGHGASPGNNFVDLVSARIGVPIINEGISGNTTGMALERIENVLARDPGVVIVLLGGNDYLRRVPKETTFENLHTIVTKFKDNDTRVLLLGVRGGLLRNTYEKEYADFAKREGIPYISNVLDGILGDTDLMYDSIHPNDKGHKIIADRVAPKLKEILNQ